MSTNRFFILIIIFSFFFSGCAKTPKSYDVVIYGGTSAGVAAAVQASRMGASVVVVEPTSRIGGLTTGGLGQTDIGNKQAIGGIAREFYQKMKVYYQRSENWRWQKPEEYRDGGQTRTDNNEDAMWTFEPSAAMNIFQGMIDDDPIQVVYNQRLNRDNGVKKNGRSIESITMESGETYTAKRFIDASYEGDLMAAAGISYTVGRESNGEYGENLNGVQPADTAFSILGHLSVNARNHNFVKGVDPYIEKGNPESGLLPCINSEGPGEVGTADRKVQAYCFRMCLTDAPDNRIPFEKPIGYKEENYELLLRNYEAGYNSIPWINSSMPNRKTDTNNNHGFSTDFIGQNYAYPEAGYTERNEIIEQHRNYQQGLMWTLANHPRIPEWVRTEVSRWGTCKDEFEREDGWQNQLYIREARRMVSDYVMTQKHCEGIEVVDDPVGLAAYGMDSHNIQRYVTSEGFVKNEGNVQASVHDPYPISYRSIIPKATECDNLLVPVCLSATHIAFGSIRMEPVFMVLGQSAATAAVLSIKRKVALHNLNYKELEEQLLKDKQRLD